MVSVIWEKEGKIYRQVTKVNMLYLQILAEFIVL